MVRGLQLFEVHANSDPQRTLSHRGEIVRADPGTHSSVAARGMTKVLLCDDEESLCRGLARLLRSAYEVVTADGPGGLARLSQETFDVVVTDLRMPGGGGLH